MDDTAAMQTAGRDGIGSPVVLVALSPVVAIGAGAGGLLVGGSWRWALLCAVLVPWALSAAAGIVLVVAVRRSQPAHTGVVPAGPPAPRDPAPRDQLVADLAWEIDLCDEDPVDLPRQRAQERGRGAP